MWMSRGRVQGERAIRHETGVLLSRALPVMEQHILKSEYECIVLKCAKIHNDRSPSDF